MSWGYVGGAAIAVVGGIIQGNKAEDAADKAADRAEAAADKANALTQQGYVDAQGRLSPFLNTETAANRQLMIEMGLGPNYTSELDSLRAELLELEGAEQQPQAQPQAQPQQQAQLAPPPGGYSPEQTGYLNDIYQQSLDTGIPPEVLAQEQQSGVGRITNQDIGFAPPAPVQPPAQTPYFDPAMGMGEGMFPPEQSTATGLQELAAAAPPGGYNSEQQAYLEALYQESLRTGIDPQVLAQQQQAPMRGVPQPQPGGRIPGGVSAPPPSVRAPIYNQTTAAANMPAVGQYTPYTDLNLGITGPG